MTATYNGSSTRSRIDRHHQRAAVGPGQQLGQSGAVGRQPGGRRAGHLDRDRESGQPRNTAGPGPTGTVTFTDGNGNVLCGGPVAVSASVPYTATCTTTYQAPGAVAVTASYSGDDAATGSTAHRSVTVAKAASIGVAVGDSGQLAVRPVADPAGERRRVGSIDRGAHADRDADFQCRRDAGRLAGHPERRRSILRAGGRSGPGIAHRDSALQRGHQLRPVLDRHGPDRGHLLADDHR